MRYLIILAILLSSCSNTKNTFYTKEYYNPKDSINTTDVNKSKGVWIWQKDFKTVKN